MSLSLTRDHFLERTKPLRYEIPEMGGHVYIRPIDGEAREKIRQLMGAGEEDENPNSLEAALAIAIGDAEGNRIFNDDDIEFLAKLPIGIKQRLLFKIWDFNGLTEQSYDDAKKN